MTQKRAFGLPEDFESNLIAELDRLGYPLDRPGRVAEAVMRLSDHYIQNPEAATPWSESWAQAAYLAYYFPLNLARARAVMKEGVRRGFFFGLQTAIDFGTGLGSARFALEEALGESQTALEALLGFDVHEAPLRLQERLAPHPGSARLSTRFDESSLPEARHRLVMMSYVLTELENLPTWAERSEALILIEPSTREDGRRLLDTRAQLLERGFTAWAPCPHQAACPLHVHSQKDWCHDRIEWQAPVWWLEIERLVPIKNRTLTFSYLLARRSPAPALPAGAARLVGDVLEEKGKTRQLLCRGPEREFLAWFPQRMKQTPDLARGELIQISENAQSKSNEVRLREASDVQHLHQHLQ